MIIIRACFVSLIIGFAFFSLNLRADGEPKASTTAVESAKFVMNVIHVKDGAATPGPAEYFTGKVSVTRAVQGEAPSDLTCGYVTFNAGAHSNWHTHPKGQLLIVTEGSGLVQEWGKAVRRIKVGDVVWTPPEVKHWHGASPDSAMTHAAITETQDGNAVVWLEHVTDKQYTASSQ